MSSVQTHRIINQSFHLLLKIDYHHCYVIVDLPLLSRWYLSNLFNCFLRVSCRLFEGLFDQDLRHFCNLIAFEELRYLLPLKLIPNAIRGQNQWHIVLFKVKYCNLWLPCNIRPSKGWKRSLEIMVWCHLFWIIELWMFESKISERASRL